MGQFHRRAAKQPRQAIAAIGAQCQQVAALSHAGGDGMDDGFIHVVFVKRWCSGVATAVKIILTALGGSEPWCELLSFRGARYL